MKPIRIAVATVAVLALLVGAGGDESAESDAESADA